MNLDKHRLTKNILVAAIMGASSVQVVVPPSLVYAANSVVANDTVPVHGEFVTGGSDAIINEAGDIKGKLDVIQDQANAVIKWKDFSIGANATVNFNSTVFNDAGEFNTLNYVNGGNLSQIYGTINADKGNIFIVNPAGVEIGNSAQINVGSLYVSNRNLDENKLNSFDGTRASVVNMGNTTGAELMSLGNINATNVTFDGDRIVLDVDRIRKPDEKPSYDNPYGQYETDKDFADNQLKIYTTDENKVIVGYTYEDPKRDKELKNNINIKVVDEENSTTKDTKISGYKWIKDYDQLQKINDELDGNFALRNSIDANGEKFNSIGDENKSFTGNFDGLGFNIYGLTIGSDTDKKDNTGLFGVVDGATIGNVNLISGEIKGKDNTGALIGKIDDKTGVTKVENILNTAHVIGNDNVGGIIGSIGNIDNENPENTDKEKSVDENVQLYGLINTGAVEGNSDVGGLVGSMNNAVLGGTSYNLADISGIDSNNDKVSDATTYNIGGLVGNAANSTIGGVIEPDESGTLIIKENDFQIYNHLDVTGGYNVGGIVGSMENSTVQNVSNDGNVTATGYTEDKYNYHTGETNGNNLSGATLNGTLATLDVKAANVGGIAGNSVKGTFDTVVNEGDISSKYNKGNDTSGYYYEAGNVGGVVGRAEDTNITDATNKEANIRGAHNVGGIAGYFGNSEGVPGDTKYTIRNGINNGGDILATGARLYRSENFAKEIIRPNANASNETFIIGNIGGIAGYMYGDNTHITQSANRGTVHTAEITDSVKESSKAANVGGIVGKIDRENTNTLDAIKKAIENDEKYKEEHNLDVYNENLISETAVSNSYNTGLVRGYTGVGGVVGMMYNGEVAGSHNLGTIQTTRVANDITIEPLNMGGIVGDTTELSNAKATIYDVYNKGQIGDETFTYYGRHVGGIVGRLSGNVEKAYNNGAIYNGFSVTGGVVGWLVDGNVNNVFNTGNITVINNNIENIKGSEVGGIIGGINDNATLNLSNIYNLGTIRSFYRDSDNSGGNDVSNTVGGIVGNIHGGNGTVTIENVYTMGNIYAGIIEKETENQDGEIVYTTKEDNDAGIGSIYGYYGNKTDNQGKVTIGKQKQDDKKKLEIINGYYITPDKGSGFETLTGDHNNSDNKAINYNNRTDFNEYKGFDFNNNVSSNSENRDSSWRIYKTENGGTTPILNAFLPKTEEYFFTHTNNADNNISSIQYGTAYDPLLTIIKANGDVSFDWQELGMSGDAGLAVYGGGLTLNNFKNLGGTGFFGGTIYTDGNLNITNVQENVDTNTDIRFGSSSKIYGSSISISADGNFEGYGDIIATGNNNGTGDISLSGDNVDIYGKLQSAVKNEDTFISGVEDTAHKHDDISSKDEAKDIKDPSKEMVAVEDRYTHKVTSGATGNITVTATDGDVNIYYGNEEKGIVDTGKDLTVNAEKGNVYIDSDMKIGGDLNAKANDEIVVDISNVGKVDTTQTVHDFLHGFEKNVPDTGTFNLDSSTSNAKITVDLWDSEHGKYNFTKYDIAGHKLTDEFDKLNVQVNNPGETSNIVYIWVEDGEQLKDIQQAAKDDGTNGRNSDVLKYNFALKNDINATDVDDYQSIGGNGTGYTGTFDGRGNRIIGLNTDGDGNSLFGIIDKIDDDKIGKVTDLKVYSSNFDTNGAIAETNNGTIDNVTGLGNHVTGTTGSVGGLVGLNNGTISSSTDRSSVTTTTDGQNTIGGLAGENSGTITDSSSNSAVIGNNAENIGGVVGSNTGSIDNADSLGITNGANNVGGIVGSNSGSGAISNVYNESIIIGSGNNIGGVAGTNKVNENDDKKGSLTNVANAGEIKATDENAGYIGGIIGNNSGTVDGGRNNARIEGNRYVGGIVGNNGATSDLHNITNDSSAFIVGEEYVGGIAGLNEGTITGEDIGTGEDKEEASLVNRGTITGQKYVGGVAGRNADKGTITNVNSDMTLNVKDKDATDDNAPMYFGGVVGLNDKEATIEDAVNSANIMAEGATYVGGIVGLNNGKLIGSGEHNNGIGNSNGGVVTGKDFVGGVAGKNTADIIGEKDKHVILRNDGEAHATDGGAGGIFAENEGKIKYAEMTNDGVVEGNKGNTTSATGGLIGVNSGDITYSSLKNEVGGQVSGVNNVGGLIGKNTGMIIGGRTEENKTDVGYYKYQIYNNGIIKGTNNVGGLIGNNAEENGKKGSLTAGYNTGAIDATGDSVGGIVGNNAGTVDQVFSTIMNKDGTEGTVTGNINVGGLIGTNSGILSNAYNTSTVDGTNAGNAIGNNTTNGTAENIYATNPTGKLIGTGKNATDSYTFVGNDTTVGDDNHKLTTEEEQKAKVSYSAFTDEDNEKDIWKFYDGNTNPLLKVFLTKVEVTDPGFEYNGYEQGFNVSADNHSDLNGIGEVTNGHLTDLSGQDFAAQANSGYNLIHANKHTNADKYDDWLYSDQIKSGGTGDNFNPNNLGYDIEYKSNDDIKIKEATITVTGSDVEHMYGSADIINNTDYSITSVTNSKGEKIKDWNKYFTLGKDSIKDTALTGNTTGKITNDVSGDYEWTGNVNVDDSIKTNLKNADSLNAEGKSKVIRADLIINVNNEQILEGETPNYTGKVSGLVNGDTESILGSHQYGVENPDIEMQVGTYRGKIGIWFNGKFYTANKNNEVDLPNYKVIINPGTLTVTPIIHPEDDKRNWNNLLNDAPWDRNRDFRERKAEFNHVNGGITIEKNDEDIVVEA